MTCSACRMVLPVPTSTSLIDTAADNRQNDAESQPSTTHQEKHFVTVNQVTLTGQTGVSADELQKIIASVKQIPYDKSHWRDELRSRIREEWQHRGYFRVSVVDGKVDVPAKSSEESVTADFLIKAGPLYRLKTIDFQNNTQFSRDELRAMFPSKDGDVFDTRQFSYGLTNTKASYRAQGFTEFSVVPAFELDDTAGLIKCIVQIDEGKNVQHAH